jgi:hypothetical protein
MVNFYSAFISSTSTSLTPLYSLLEWAVPWVQEAPQKDKFRNCIQAFSSDLVLVPYLLDLPVWLTSDVSSEVGTGAILSQVMPGGKEHPVSYASKIFTKVKCGYAHVQREAAIIIFGIMKYYKYLWG